MKSFFLKSADAGTVFRIPITKIDVARREVWGTAALEQQDRASEIMDYDSSKPNFEAWSKSYADATDGASLGNLRAMHTRIAAGKLIAFQPDDATKSFQVGTKVVDDNEWAKVQEGVYTGFSIGGDYVRRWDDPVLKGVKRYTANPSELSLVDAPCIPGAMFDVIKSDGSKEMRKFVAPVDAAPAATDNTALLKSLTEGLLKTAGVMTPAMLADAITSAMTKSATLHKTVGGEQLTIEAFAFAPDATDTRTWEHPVQFSTAEKSLPYIRTAFGKVHSSGIPVEKQLDACLRIFTAARANKMADPKEFAEKAIKGMFPHSLKKSMYDVGTLADLMSSLAWMQMRLVSERDMEGDDSTVPDELKAAMVALKQVFINLATEEVNELVVEKDTADKALKALMPLPGSLFDLAKSDSPVVPVVVPAVIQQPAPANIFALASAC